MKDGRSQSPTGFRSRRRFALGVVGRVWVPGALLAVLGAFAARASDGVLEINQACASGGGCFPGDAPDLPVTITGSPGRSYRLTSDLITLAFNVNLIDITGDHVTLDLNGFALRCVPLLGNACTGSGIGINAPMATNVAVQNGTVQGMSAQGVRLGSAARVERVRAVGNGGEGIRVGSRSTVRENTCHQNGGVGIVADDGSLIAENTVSQNGGTGISTSDAASIQHNVVSGNGSVGIGTSGACTIAGNTIFGNGSHGILTAASTVAGNTSVGNTGSGINASNGSLVHGNIVRSNTGYGLLLFNAAYRENVTSANSTGDVSGGLNLGANACGLVLCP